jgi:LysM repeat protein
MLFNAGSALGPALSGLTGSSPRSPTPRAAATTPQAAAAEPVGTPAPAAVAPAATSAATPQPTAAARATTSPAATTPSPSPAGSRTHIVEPGDTLWSLAQQYSTTVDAIVAANSLADRSATLRIGQPLTIPAPAR